MSVENLEPASTTERKVWGPWATAGFGCGVMVVIVFSQTLLLGIYIAVRYGHTLQSVMTELQASITGALGLIVSLSAIESAVVGLGLIFLIIKLRKKLTVTEYLGLKPISLKTILVLLAITVGFIVLSDGLTLILGKQTGDFQLAAYRTSMWPALFWLAVVVFGPVFEETMFRGFLFEGFRLSRIGVIGAIVLTALIWSLLHVQYEMYEIGTIFVLGIILGIVRYKTGSLWSTLLMHGFLNFVATVETVLYVNGILG